MRTLGRVRGLAVGILVWAFLFDPVHAVWDPESLSSEESENVDLSVLVERLAQDPLDANRACASDVEALGLLTPEEVGLLVAGRPWASVDAVCTALELDAVRAELVRAALYLPRRRRARGGHVRSSVGSAAGWRSLDPVRVVTGARAEVAPGVHVGWVQEKDPGERRIMDRWGGYVRWEGGGPLTHLIVGDFTLRYGQGLLFWPDGPAVLEMSRLIRRAEGGRGFSGSSESGFLRGVVAEGRWDGWSFSGFVSRQRVDARVDDEDVVTGFPTSGYHRTPSERAARARARVTLVGGRMSVRREGARMGITLYREAYAPEILLGDPDRDGVRASGSTVRGGTCDWILGGERSTLLGEVSFGQDPSCVVGWVHRRPVIETAIWVRRLARFLYSPHGSLATVRRAAMRNEEGASFGLCLEPRPGLMLSVLADLETRLWRTWTVSLPPRTDQVQWWIEWVRRGVEVSARWKTQGTRYLERAEERTVRRTLRMRVRPGEAVAWGLDLKDAESAQGRGALGQACVTLRSVPWEATVSWVAAWLEEGAPFLSGYVRSCPGQLRFMQAWHSGWGRALLLKGRVPGGLEVSLYLEEARFGSVRRWVALQLDARF